MAMFKRKCKLTCIEGGKTMRTKEVVGVVVQLPRKGLACIIKAPSLENPDPDATRFIITSDVQGCTYENGVFHFTTQNSEYRLELLEKEMEDYDA